MPITSVHLGVVRRPRGMLARVRARGRIRAHAADVLSAGSVSPSYGQSVTVTATIANTGGSTGSFGLLGTLVLAGTSTPVGSLNGGPSAMPLAAGASTSVTLVSDSIGYGNSISGYNPGAGLDILLFLGNAGTGTATGYLIPSAVFLPMPSTASGTSTGGSSLGGSGYSGTSFGTTGGTGGTTFSGAAFGTSYGTSGGTGYVGTAFGTGSYGGTAFSGTSFGTSFGTTYGGSGYAGSSFGTGGTTGFLAGVHVRRRGRAGMQARYVFGQPGPGSSGGSGGGGGGFSSLLHTAEIGAAVAAAAGAVYVAAEAARPVISDVRALKGGRKR